MFYSFVEEDLAARVFFYWESILSLILLSVICDGTKLDSEFIVPCYLIFEYKISFSIVKINS